MHWRSREVQPPGECTMMRRIVLGLFVFSLLASTGCFWRRNCCGHYSKTSRMRGGDVGMMSGCNECSGYMGPEMFGTPVHGNAGMYQPPIDERLNAPAKQTPYEGPAKK
jgi:hypothetical protein